MPIEISHEKTMIIRPEDGALEVTVPIRWVRTKGQRRIHSPSNLTRVIVDETLRSNLIKAHKWERKLLQGQATSIQDLACKENVDKSDMSKILRLTTLAPDIQVDLLLRKGEWLLSWSMLKGGFPLEWQEQRASLREKHHGFC